MAEFNMGVDGALADQILASLVEERESGEVVREGIASLKARPQ
jgi:hypothetical protein